MRRAGQCLFEWCPSPGWLLVGMSVPTLLWSGLTEDITCVIAGLQEMEKPVNSLRLARNTVSSKTHRCAASQKWLDAAPECFGVYPIRLRWGRWSVTQLAASAKQLSPCKHEDSTYCLGNIQPTIWLSRLLLSKRRRNLFFPCFMKHHSEAVPVQPFPGQMFHVKAKGTLCPSPEKLPPLPAASQGLWHTPLPTAKNTPFLHGDVFPGLKDSGGRSSQGTS